MIVGYAAGLYDLFHVGHLRALQAAKGMCDMLIVGVINDEVAKKYRKVSPIIPFHQRFEIINALGCVDAAIECTTRDFYEQWKLFKYDVAFSGEDWSNDQAYLHWGKMLEKEGVALKFLPRTTEISSTKIRETIRGKS